MLKPLPCPFCGKLPRIEPKNPERDGDAWGAVTCVNKRCATFNGRDEGVSVGDGSLIADSRGPDKYKEAAIRRWNRRAST
jgi:hypothetical protein